MGRFIASREAVSPVIGVILMVAITVVLAGTVFFIATRLRGDHQDAPPEFVVYKDNTARDLRVVRASPQLDWFRDMRIGGSCSPTLNGAAYPTALGTPIAAGDVLHCSAGQDVQISSSAAKGNTLLYQTAFQ